ncbi:MAG: hypothetical protein RRY07_05195 [Bacteroidaceae bacterium]
MNRLLTNILLAVGCLSASLNLSAQDNVTLANGEYWIDQQFDSRKSVPLTGEWATDLNVSGLREGIHTLHFRASDSKGRWSVPILRYFLRCGRSLESNAASGYELWIDNDFEHRTSGTLTDNMATMELNMATRLPGLHNISFRTSDSNGQWSVPRIKHFLVMGKELTDNALTVCRYWTDSDFDHVQEATPNADGTIDLQLDMSRMGKGLHTFCYQVGDKENRLSPAIVRYFVVPDTLPANNSIVGYSYWFNHGPRVRVDIAPANPLELSNFVVEIKDVVPNEITAGYIFDPVMSTVLCDDHVFFGMEAYDKAGHATSAVLSDTFDVQVPVSVSFTELQNSVPSTFRAPGAGQICGFTMHAEIADTLLWTVTKDCTVDAYAADGTKIVWVSKTSEDGCMTYQMKAASKLTYVLLHHASAVLGESTITCAVMPSVNGITGVTANGCTFNTGVHCLQVKAATKGMLQITNMAGMEVYADDMPVGLSRVPLATGVYLLSWDGIYVGKVAIP